MLAPPAGAPHSARRGWVYMSIPSAVVTLALFASGAGAGMIAGGPMKGGGGDGGDPRPGGGGGGGPTSPVLYTIERNSDRLMRIDPATGVVSDVGPVGWDMADADLTMHAGRLFAVNTNSAGAALLELDPASGNALSVTALVSAGSPVILAEGLTSLGGALFVGYSSASSGFQSNLVGQLALDGSIRQTVDLSAFSAGADLDGMGADPLLWRLASVDVRPGAGTINLYDLGSSGSRYDLIEQHAQAGLHQSVNDIEFMGSVLFGLDDLSNHLHLFDAATGSLSSSLPLVGGSDLRGLALALPTPGALALLGLAALAAASKRNRTRPL